MEMSRLAPRRMKGPEAFIGNSKETAVPDAEAGEDFRAFSVSGASFDWPVAGE